MKLSERYLQHLKEEIEGEQGIVIEEIKTYGQICRLEGKKKEAIDSLRGSDKACRVMEIKKQLEQLTIKYNIA